MSWALRVAVAAGDRSLDAFPDVRHASADLASHMRLRAHDEPGVLATDGSLLIFPRGPAPSSETLSNPMGAEASSEQTCSAIRNSALRVAVYARQNHVTTNKAGELARGGPLCSKYTAVSETGTCLILRTNL